MYPSIWQILIILVIVLMLFGHKKIRQFGGALGEGLRDFKKGLEGKSENTSSENTSSEDTPTQNENSNSN